MSFFGGVCEMCLQVWKERESWGRVQCRVVTVGIILQSKMGVEMLLRAIVGTFTGREMGRWVLPSYCRSGGGGGLLLKRTAISCHPDPSQAVAGLQ